MLDFTVNISRRSETLIGSDVRAARAKSYAALSPVKFLNPYLSREHHHRPRVNCISSLSESHYLNASANGGRVSYKFATQYHFIIAWHPPRYELWNEAHVRLCSISHRAGGYNTSENTESDINENDARSGAAAYGIIMRRKRATANPPRSGFCLESEYWIMPLKITGERERARECLRHIIINCEIPAAFHGCIPWNNRAESPWNWHSGFRILIVIARLFPPVLLL